MSETATTATTEFAVPCVCGERPDHPIHDPMHWREWKDGHTHDPDESSVEYAAVKLREALDDLLHHWAFGGSESGIGSRVQAGHEALALADAAGIKATTTTTTTTTTVPP